MVDAADGITAFHRRDAFPTTRADASVEAVSPAWLDRYSRFAADAPHGAAQEPAWLRAWSGTNPEGMLAITLREAGAPVLMLALETVRRGPFSVARFIGGSHANASFPAASGKWKASPGRLREVAEAVRRARADIDLLLFERMPARHGGMENPLLASGGAPSPDPALSLALEPTIEETLKRLGDRRKAKKHRSKQRKFAEAGGFRRIEAESDEEVERLLAAFFRFKAVRFREAGIANVFAEHRVQRALAETFKLALGEPSRPFVLHALEVGGAIRAVSGSSQTAERVTCDFVGIAEDELSRQSPGEFLFYENIADACRTGRRFYDFGIGDEPYKRHWCDIETTHFDAALGVTHKGRVLGAGLAAVRRAKAAVKGNPRLWNAFKALRRGRGAVAAEGGEG